MGCKIWWNRWVLIKDETHSILLDVNLHLLRLPLFFFLFCGWDYLCWRMHLSENDHPIWDYLYFFIFFLYYDCTWNWVSHALLWGSRKSGLNISGCSKFDLQELADAVVIILQRVDKKIFWKAITLRALWILFSMLCSMTIELSLNKMSPHIF